MGTTEIHIHLSIHLSANSIFPLWVGHIKDVIPSCICLSSLSIYLHIACLMWGTAEISTFLSTTNRESLGWWGVYLSIYLQVGDTLWWWSGRGVHSRDSYISIYMSIYLSIYLKIEHHVCGGNDSDSHLSIQPSIYKWENPFVGRCTSEIRSIHASVLPIY